MYIIYSLVRELSGLSGWDEIKRLKENEVWNSDNINLLLPLIDIPNHYHPKNANKSDYARFSLKAFPTSPGHPILKMKSIGISTSHPLL